MNGWIPWVRYHGGHWVRIGAGTYPTQERAKAECKKHLAAEPHNAHRLDFRTTAGDAGQTVYQESHAPHGRRMRWHDVAW